MKATTKLLLSLILLCVVYLGNVSLLVNVDSSNYIDKTSSTLIEEITDDSLSLNVEPNQLSIFSDLGDTSANLRTITFQSNGGSLVSPIIQDFGTALTAPVNPTKTGYIFSGWYSDIELINDYTFTIMPTENITLYAKWIINPYTITFDSNGGSVVLPYTQEIINNFGVAADVATSITNICAIYAADLDGDGYVDVIGENYSGGTITWYKNNGDGTFALPATIIFTTGTISSIHAADLDNDGDIDVLSTDSDQDKSTWYKNNGSGIFTEQTAFSLTSLYPNSIYAEDLDNDGDLDVLTANGISDSIEWYENNGDGTFEVGIELTNTADGAKNVYAADLDNDGDMDVLSASMNDDKITWFLNNGNQTFTEQTAITLSADGALDVYAADLDNDGYMDVLSASYLDRTIAWYKNNGNGTFTEQTPITTTEKYTYSVHAADLDNDGDIDVLSTSPLNDEVSWYLNNGDGTFTRQTPFSDTVVFPHTVYAADLDNDGDIDAIASVLNDEKIVWFENNVELSDAIYEPADPTRVGHTFVGWYSDASLTTAYSFTTAPTADITLYAKWTANSYTLEYKNFDGTVLQTNSVAYGSDLSLLTVPVPEVRTGYTFTGWDISLPATMPEYTITITAQYTINTYTVEYLDYDLSVLQSTDFEYGDDLSGLFYSKSYYSRTGYVFTDWDTLLPATMPANNITLIAEYELRTFTLEFKNYDLSTMESFVIEYGYDLSLVTVPTPPIKTGYTFTGWDISLPATMPNNDVTITALYTINTYTVEFLDYDSRVIQTDDFDYGAYLGVLDYPESPSRIGYWYNGWDSNFPTFMPDHNITITATYSIESYNIYFYDYDNTTLIQIQRFEYSTDIRGITFPDSTREGYSFTGWDTSLPGTMPGNDLYLTAEYSINSYTLVFEDYDGNVLRTNIYEFDTDLSRVSNPENQTRTGYTFIGWSQSIPATMPANNIIITASYNINSYTVKYIGDGFSVIRTDTFEYDSVLSGVTFPADPTLTGHTFTGWDISLPATMPANNIEINALFTANTYTMKYLDYDGVTILLEEDHIYASSLIGADSPDPTRIGYSFIGWDISYPSFMPANDVTFVAQYSINTYTLKYVDYDGLSTVQTVDYLYLTDLSGLASPESPTRIGYTFTGWDISLPGTMPGNNLTITAEYTINSYTLEYVDYNLNMIQTANFEYGADLSGVTSPESPTRIGYTFTGWDISLPGTMPSDNITMIAVYTVNTYTLEYLDYDGITSLQTEDFSFLTDLSAVISPVNPTRIGYTFTGWNISLPGTMPANNLTITATYTINTYTLKYVDVDGTTTIQTVDFSYLADLSGVTPPVNPTRTGYTFTGWDITLPGTMPANDITVTAEFTINSYTIKFVDYDSTTIQTIDYEYNTSLSELSYPDNPNRVNYTFSGWDITIPETMPANDVTLTAEYNMITYKIEFVDYDSTVIQTVDYHLGDDLSGLVQPNNPTRIGYTFNGWDKGLPATMTASDITLQATYSLTMFTLEFVDYNSTVIQTATYAYGEDLSGVLYPSDPTRTGYTFHCWDNSIPTTMPLNNIVIQSCWVLVEEVSDDSLIDEVSGLLDFVENDVLIPKDVEVYIDVHTQLTEEVKTEEELLIHELIEENIDKNSQHFNLDVSLYYKIDGESPVYVTELSDMITITIVIPEECKGSDTYYIVRIHDGVSTILETTYDEVNQTLSFETDMFSTYSIIYNNDSSLLYLLWILLVPALLALYFTYKKSDSKKKEKHTSTIKE